MSTYKFYYINLDKSKDRRDFMENQFKKLNIPITRMPAVYGKELPSSFLKKAKKQHQILTHFPYLNDGEIGLTKTYFDLWKIVAKQKEDFSIILEDDALINEKFFKDLQNILLEITTNDFIDIAGRKGFYTLKKNSNLTTYLIPALQTTGQIIGKEAAKTLAQNLTTYYAPIDVLKQDIFKHKVKVYTTNKCYVISNDKNLGGTTLQQKKMPKVKKILREVTRPFWQIITLITYKLQRCIRNYIFYKKL
ncbi:glycosyltransferase family 25 protein [Polaribacter septentrionalilitoris]|uniref:glycosyltransferase family 25 protein n=1 Tax=Polaribacter septentrionalilitoris TaxID=2494657 RepID=UPI001F191077|nr:glycosyltransferase family 25 protein [Polaribacter septentrionalilitoris]